MQVSRVMQLRGCAVQEKHTEVSVGGLSPLPALVVSGHVTLSGIGAPIS